MERLSGVTPVVFSQLVFPSAKEGDVAGHIQDNLTGLAALVIVYQGKRIERFYQGPFLFV
jgi:hypothetical protein